MKENAAWGYSDPIDGAPPLAGDVAFYWWVMDTWLEEDERVFVHPRDPYHRIDVVPTSRHVRISAAGEVLADTTRARVLFETSLPARWYLPAGDGRTDLLAASDNTTRCPYKGEASYWSLGVGPSSVVQLVEASDGGVVAE